MLLSALMSCVLEIDSYRCHTFSRIFLSLLLYISVLFSSQIHPFSVCVHVRESIVLSLSLYLSVSLFLHLCPLFRRSIFSRVPSARPLSDSALVIS